MAVTKTRADLIEQALANLGVLAAGQTPAAEDFDTVDGHVDQTFAALSDLDIVTVTDDAAIPIAWFQPLSVLLADDAAMEFGLPGVPASASSPDPVTDAENRLRELTRGKPNGQPLRIDYF